MEMNNAQAKAKEQTYALEILLAKTQLMMLLRVTIVAFLLGCLFISRYMFGIPYPTSIFFVIAIIAVLYNTFFSFWKER